MNDRPTTLLTQIDPAQPAGWEDKVFLSLDIDWAHDAVLADTIDLLEHYDVPATWFVTHDTPLLARLRANPRFELGIHPNFNFLLEGDSRSGANAAEVIDRLLALVPEARAVRSHSMTQNTRILDLFAARGLTHDCNHFIPSQSGITLKPWRTWHGLTKVPYLWEDDIACIYGALPDFRQTLDMPGLKLLDFHPIHLYLNSPDMDYYETTRSAHRDAQALPGARNTTRLGVRDIFCQWLEAR